MLLAGLWPKDWRFDPPAQAHSGNDAQDATSCCSCLRFAASVGVMGWLQRVIEPLEIVIGVDFISLGVSLQYTQHGNKVRSQGIILACHSCLQCR